MLLILDIYSTIDKILVEFHFATHFQASKLHAGFQSVIHARSPIPDIKLPSENPLRGP